jgi:hypothetical protein
MKVRSQLALTTAFASAICCTAVSANAEPIVAVYAVQVLQRTSFPLNAVEPYSQEFMLAMSFDPALSQGPGSYGPVSFSMVPLEGPPAPPGLPAQPQISNTTHRADFGFALVASATDTEASGFPYIVDGEILGYQKFVALRNFQRQLESAPVFTPETFPLHLGLLPTDSDGGFNFLYVVTTLGGAPGIRTGGHIYNGTATLVDVNPIPEPATLLLAGSGLALLMGRRSQRRKTVRRA